MSTDALIPFDFRGTQVRVVSLDGEPWFVAADVCFVLGYRNSRDAVAKHVRSPQRGMSRIATPSGDQDMTVISEGGLYRLIMRANTVLVDEFQDWVTDEVLPSIRKTGSYTVEANAPSRENLVASVTRRELASWLIEAEDRAVLAEAKVADLEPAAHSWEQLAEASGDFAVADAAKVLSRDPSITIGRDRLFAWLESRNWIYRGEGGRYRAYQKAIDLGQLAERLQSSSDADGSRINRAPQVRVTVKGIHDIHRLLGGSGPLLLEVA